METAGTAAFSSVTEDMAWIESATFRMGSDRHYAEEAPSHHVAVKERPALVARAVVPVLAVAVQAAVRR